LEAGYEAFLHDRIRGARDQHSAGRHTWARACRPFMWHLTVTGLLARQYIYSRTTGDKRWRGDGAQPKDACE